MICYLSVYIHKPLLVSTEKQAYCMWALACMQKSSRFIFTKKLSLFFLGHCDFTKFYYNKWSWLHTMDFLFTYFLHFVIMRDFGSMQNSEYTHCSMPGFLFSANLNTSDWPLSWKKTCSIQNRKNIKQNTIRKLQYKILKLILIKRICTTLTKKCILDMVICLLLG